MSIKPGAQAPGSNPPTMAESAKRATAVTTNVNRNEPAVTGYAGLNAFNDTFLGFRFAPPQGGVPSRASRLGCETLCLDPLRGLGTYDAVYSLIGLGIANRRPDPADPFRNIGYPVLCAAIERRSRQQIKRCRNASVAQSSQGAAPRVKPKRVREPWETVERIVGAAERRQQWRQGRGSPAELKGLVVKLLDE